RKVRVGGDEGRQQQGGAGGADQLPGALQVDVEYDPEQEEDQDQREDERADGSPVQQPSLDAQLRLGACLLARRAPDLADLVVGVSVLMRSAGVLRMALGRGVRGRLAT